MSRLVRITVSPRDPATGLVAIKRLAGGGQYTPYFFDNQHWRAGLVDIPRFRSAIGWDATGWTGGSVPSTGAIGFAPSLGADLDEMGRLFWNDAPILIETAEETGGALSWSIQLTGTIKSMEQREGKLVFTLTDLGGPLDRPVITARFAGTGGLEGGAEASGRLKRRTWGRAFNVECRVFEKAYNIYEYGDPAFPHQACDQIRDIGRAGSLAILAWQGTAAATLAALRGVAVAAGGGVAAPSICMARWWTQPSGPLTVDVRGEIGMGYVETIPEIAGRIVAGTGAGGIANVSATAAIRGGVAGYHVDSDTETVALALDRLLLPVSLIWVLDADGPIRLLPITLDAPIATVRSLQVTRQQMFPPMATRRIGYQRAWRTHGDGEISSLLYAQDVAFADGTKLADVKPAEAGADVTGNHTSNDTANVAGVPSSMILDQLNTLGTITGTGPGSITYEIGVLSDSLDGTRADLATAQADLDAAEAGLAVVQANLTTAQSALTLVTTQVRLRPNLQVNGNFDRGYDGLSGPPSGAGSFIDINNPHVGNYYGHTLEGTFTTQMPPIYLVSGQTYSVSYDRQLAASSGLIWVDVVFYPGLGGAGAGLYVGQSGYPAMAIHQEPVGTGFTEAARQQFQFVMPAGYLSARVRLVTYQIVAPLSMGFRRIKVEIGGLPASLWSNEATGNLVDASIKQVDTARANDFAASASRFVTVESRLTTTEGVATTSYAGFTSLTNTVVTQYAAQSSLNTSLISRLDATEGVATSAYAGFTSLTNTTATQYAAQVTINNSLTARVGAVEGVAAGAAANYTTLANTLATGNAAQATVNSRLLARVGTRRNLVVNGGLERGAVGVGLPSGFQVAGANSWGPYVAGPVATGTGSIPWPAFSVYEGATYTIAADTYLFAPSGSVYVDLIFYSASNAVLKDGAQNPRSGEHGFSSGVEGRDAIAVSDTAPPGATYAVPRFVWVGVPVGSYVGVREIKAELGELPCTAYNIAGGSFEQSYAEIATNSSAIAGTNAALATLSTVLTAAVSTAQGAADGAAGNATLALGQISSLSTVVANNNTAASSRLDTVEASVGGLSAQATIQAGALAALDGRTQAYVSLGAIAGTSEAKLTVGSVGGIGGFSAINLDADIIRLNAEHVIINGTIVSDKLASNATFADGFVGGAASSTGSGYTDVASITYSPQDPTSRLLVLYAGSSTLSSGSASGTVMYLSIGGGPAQAVVNDLRGDLPVAYSGFFFAVGTGGTRTYTLSLRPTAGSGSGDPHAMSGRIFIIELKRGS